MGNEQIKLGIGPDKLLLPNNISLRTLELLNKSFGIVPLK